MEINSPIWVQSAQVHRRRPVAVDLFSGVGGMSLGFEQAGFDVAVALEYDPVHAAVHKFNFPLCGIICDDANYIAPTKLHEVTKTSLRRYGNDAWDGEIDVVFGGPPCQGFSTIGKRRIEDERNRLVERFAVFVRELRPRYFVMENVPGLASGSHASILVDLCGRFGGEYIVVPHRMLNSCDFGAPQDRRRLILLGHRRDQEAPRYPSPIVRRAAKRTPKGEALLSNPVLFDVALRNGPTVWDAIGDLPDLDRFPELLVSDEVRLSESVVEEMERVASRFVRGLRALDYDAGNIGYPRVWDRFILTSSRRTVHTENSIKRFKLTESGQTDDVSHFYKLDAGGLCNTLRAGSGSERGAFTSPRPLHPKLPRVISVREGARLHGFPDWFRFHRTKSNGFRQLGNSVPPPLAHAIAVEIIRALDVNPCPARDLNLGDTRLLNMSRLEAAAYFAADFSRIPKARTRG